MADADLRPIPYLGTSLVTAEPVKIGTVRQFRRAAGRSPVGCRAGSAGVTSWFPAPWRPWSSWRATLVRATSACIWSPPSARGPGPRRRRRAPAVRDPPQHRTGCCLISTARRHRPRHWRGIAAR
jgi:hypothetical protein